MRGGTASRASMHRRRADRRSGGRCGLHRDAAATHASWRCASRRRANPAWSRSRWRATHDECVRMAGAFRAAGVPLWVAYYRRALPRFLTVRELLRGGPSAGSRPCTSRSSHRLATGAEARNWRFDPAHAGAGLFFDLGVALPGPGRLPGSARSTDVAGFAFNTGGTYAAEDVTSAAYRVHDTRWPGPASGISTPSAKTDRSTFTGSEGTLATPVFTRRRSSSSSGGRARPSRRNPPHVHQPLIQTIVDELRGQGRCESTGETGARTSWVLDRCVEEFYVSRA